MALSKDSTKLSTPAKFGVGAVLCGLLAVAYLFLFHFELDEKLARERSRTTQLEAELSAQKRAEASYFADRDELALREQKQREYNRILPADTQAAAFLSAVQQVANVSGVNLRAWQPMDEVPQSFFAKVPMKLELEGKFHQIAKFTYEIGKTDRIINVENLEISDAKQEGDEVVLKAKCLATTFHLIAAKEPDAAAAAAQGKAQ